MKDIYDTILRLQSKVNKYAVTTVYSQQDRDAVSREFNKTLDIIIRMTDPIEIERLVQQENIKDEWF